jgi:hypothetical protein
MALTQAPRKDGISLWPVAGAPMSDWQPDLARFEVDLIDRAQTSPPQKTWIYIDATRALKRGSHSKVPASLELARAWLTENDPEGAAFDYKVFE